MQSLANISPIGKYSLALGQKYWMRNTISNAQVKLESAELIDDLDIKVSETFLFENPQMKVKCF